MSVIYICLCSRMLQLPHLYPQQIQFSSQLLFCLALLQLSLQVFYKALTLIQCLTQMRLLLTGFLKLPSRSFIISTCSSLVISPKSVGFSQHSLFSPRYLATICRPQPMPSVHSPPTSHVRLLGLCSTVVLWVNFAVPVLGVVAVL